MSLEEVLLSAQRLTIRFAGGVTALRAVDLEIPDSGITCLLGANGAGKTTLLESAAGLTTPTEGRLFVRGRAPGSIANRLSIGVMLQDGGLPGSARPRDFLRYIARLYPHPRDVDSLMEMVEIDPGLRTPIRRLSGGQARRVSWAAAMVGDPEALLLDEPTAGVDPIGRERLNDVLRGEGQRGVSMIIATHLLEDVDQLADRVVVLRRGRVVLSGTPQELRPRNTLLARSTRELDMASLLVALPAGSSCLRESSDTYRIDVPTGIDPAVMTTVASWCSQHSVMPDLTIADLASVLRAALRDGDET